MRNIINILPLIILFCLQPFLSAGQGSKAFSPDPAIFVQEVAAMYAGVSNSKAREEVNTILQEFFLAWDSSYFSNDEKTLVIENANMLKKRRLTDFPYLLRYFHIISRLKNGPDPTANLSWLRSVSDLDEQVSLRLLQEYIDLFDGFLSDRIMNRSSSITWQVSDTSYLLVYDTVARFVFRKTDLTCYTSNDTSILKATSGNYYPTLMKWDGFGGKLSWERNGLDPDSVYALLQEYRINLKFSSYSADSVVFYNKAYFQEPLYGSLEEKILSSPPGKWSSSPRFTSYLKNYEIPNLFEGISYVGGFSMEGAKLIGSGERFENSVLTISREKELIMKVNSNAFYIEGDELSCNPAAVVIYVNGDSIFHPGLQMKYYNNTRTIRLVRPESGLAQSPFFNTYHNLNMNCSAMNWDMTTDSINFETVRGVNRNSTVEFISDNYFAQVDFYRLQGIDEKNPLYVIRSFSEKYSTNEITPEMLASFMNKPVEQAKSMLLKLSIQGFLFYDQVNDRAIIQDKLNHFIQASVGKKDHDVIRILSETFNQPNASLNLKSNDLLIRGVSEVLVSDSQQVYIYPALKEIIVKKNRDFVFTGSVKAGLFEFYANECSFEYDSFRLNLPTVDSLLFSVKSFTKNEYGVQPLRKVRSVIEDVGGRLLINFPSNKSGLRDFPEFPIFISEKDSYVYYDRDKAYPRDRFKYTIYPYVIDSLDNFLTDYLQFKGELESADIFPRIYQPLKVQSDYSLGFMTSTPEEGYPVYQGKGTFYREIFLSHQGLEGKGQLNYLTSVTQSDHMKFYPDSLRAYPAEEYTVLSLLGPVEYPDLNADSVMMAWYPKSDTMLLADLDDPFRLFDDQVELTGGLTYTPESLTGKGVVRYENAGMVSEKFYFNHKTFLSDTVDFTLYEEGSGDEAVTADNYRALVDVDKRLVKFRTNQAGSTVAFPYNQFISYMDNIDWFIDRNEMVLTNDLAVEVPDLMTKSKEELIDFKMGGSEFVSINPEMDSLRFFAMNARYNLDNYFIFAEDVMILRIADAAIFPDSGFIRIYQGGKLETLSNAGIIADTALKIHHIVRADLDVISRNKYTGSGTYLFESKGLPVREIVLNEIGVDINGVTVANGRVPEKDNFLINPYFAFAGNAVLHANDPLLDFEGGFRIFQDCYRPRRDDWVWFHNRLDPEDVRITLANPIRTVGGDDIETSMFISDYEDEIYPAIFENRILTDDIIMYKATGTISYDTVTDRYGIFEAGSGAPQEGDRYFYLDRKSCSVDVFGQIDMALDFNYIDLLSYGQMSYLVVPDSATFNLTLSLDFFIDESLLNMMADSIFIADLKGVDIAGPAYSSVLNQMLGAQKAAELKQDIAVYGTMRRMPEELVHTLVFTDLNMSWNSVSNSYVSSGPIGILGTGSNAVNRYVNGYVELIKRRSADVVTLYLELSPSQYYFFDYRADIMQVVSSDIKFNERIESIKPEKRTTSRPEAEFSYEYTVSTRRRVLEFLRRMEN